ncbi:DUF5317 domain-containing protein [Candidatus Acetothermia bacterium]|nr:DUF5317 domain-containing protein [Candidatus Acetothermia bacterium]
MLLVWPVLIGLIIGFLRGGRIAQLGALPLKVTWLIPISLVIQLLIFPLIAPQPIIAWGTEYFHIGSYVLLVVFVVINRRLVPLVSAGLGMITNFIVIVINGGYMPVSITALSRTGAEGIIPRLQQYGYFGNVMLMSEQTALNFLGDILYLPRFIPFSVPFSIGDVIISIGIGWLVVRGMGRSEKG